MYRAHTNKKLKTQLLHMKDNHNSSYIFSFTLNIFIL